MGSAAAWQIASNWHAPSLGMGFLWRPILSKRLSIFLKLFSSFFLLASFSSKDKLRANCIWDRSQASMAPEAGSWSKSCKRYFCDCASSKCFLQKLPHVLGFLQREARCVRAMQRFSSLSAKQCSKGFWVESETAPGKCKANSFRRICDFSAVFLATPRCPGALSIFFKRSDRFCLNCFLTFLFREEASSGPARISAMPSFSNKDLTNKACSVWPLFWM